MDNEKGKRFDEHSEDSPNCKIKLPEEGIAKTAIVSVETISFNLLKLGSASFKSTIKSPECLSENINGCDIVKMKSNVIVFSGSSKVSPSTTSKRSPPSTSKRIPPSTSKMSPPSTSKMSPPSTSKMSPPSTSKMSPPSTSKMSPPSTSKMSPPSTSKISPPSTSKTSSPKLLMDLTKSMFGVEELLSSVNMQTEETKEMLDVVSHSKEKLEFFIAHVECLLKSLNENSEYSATIGKGGNTYVKNMYRKKLEEFALRLLDKVKTSIEYLEVEYETLKEQENKISETCGKISEFKLITDNAANDKDALLNETVDQLLEDIHLMKLKQLSEIRKVSYIETDIEMLYDLYRRFGNV